MYYISGFYKFKRIYNAKKNKKILQCYFIKKGPRGSLIVSNEGINGTLSAKKKHDTKTHQWLRFYHKES